MYMTIMIHLSNNGNYINKVFKNKFSYEICKINWLSNGIYFQKQKIKEC